MTTLIRVLFLALISFATTNNAMAFDCGDCPGDKAETHEHTEAHGDEAPAVTCSCAKGKAGETVWCAACKAGYHEGKKIGCEGCFKKASGQSDKACENCAGPKKTEEEA